MLLEPRDQGETTDRRRCFLGLQPADVGFPLGLAPMVVVARDVDRATRVQSTIDQRGDTD